MTPAKAVRNIVYALGKGVLKVMSKMGISTVASYTGAQVFASLGIDSEVIDEYFEGTSSPAGGSDLDVLAADVAARHAMAFTANTASREHRGLPVGGDYQWRREGELHLFNPETVYLLQHSTRSKQESVFRRYTDLVNSLSRKGGTLRGMFELRTDTTRAVPLEDVEPASEIVRRFVTGAMSYGSISAEAHTTLAIAMNRLGGSFQHRGGRRGHRPAARPEASIGDQAGRLWPVRGDQRLSGERGRDPDQDGAGGETR